MNQWVRLYTEVLNDPKVQRLDGETFKAWINILCLAGQNGGKLPPVSDIAFALRMDDNGVVTVLERLLNGGLIDKLNGGADGYHYAPHEWAKRQYKSDTSTDRVKRFRERSKTVTVTAPEAEAETEVTVDKSTDGVAVVDPAKIMFDAGVSLIVRAGKSESTARAWLGKSRKAHGVEAVIAAISRAKCEGAIDPISFMEGALRAKARSTPRPVVPI